MSPSISLARRSALRAATFLVAGAIVGPALAHWLPPAPKPAQLEVYDRATGATLPVHEKDGRHFIVGTPGHEYAMRIRNSSGTRILAVTSVDGINVISGETASPAQSGYVIEPWGSVEIAGWRKSLSRTAAFYFTEHSNSYAARTGRPFDVGVIGVVVFAERITPPPYRIGESHAPRRESRVDRAEAAADAPASPPHAAASASSEPAAEAQRDDAFSRDRRLSPQPLAKLGTGHGRNETSHARQVAFERATSEPAQILTLQYDRRENLVALGVLPATQHHLARRAPQAFPGLRFTPDPN